MRSRSMRQSEDGEDLLLHLPLFVRPQPPVDETRVHFVVSIQWIITPRDQEHAVISAPPQSDQGKPAAGHGAVLLCSPESQVCLAWSFSRLSKRKKCVIVTKVRLSAQLSVAAADQKPEKTRVSGHLKYFLKRNAQNSVAPAFISDSRRALCCFRIKCTMWNFILSAPISRSKDAEVHQ